MGMEDKGVVTRYNISRCVFCINIPFSLVMCRAVNEREENWLQSLQKVELSCLCAMVATICLVVFENVAK